MNRTRCLSKEWSIFLTFYFLSSFRSDDWKEVSPIPEALRMHVRFWKVYERWKINGNHWYPVCISRSPKFADFVLEVSWPCWWGESESSNTVENLGSFRLCKIIDRKFLGITSPSCTLLYRKSSPKVTVRMKILNSAVSKTKNAGENIALESWNGLPIRISQM